MLTDPTLPSHYEMMAAIRAKLDSWGPGVFIGYNSLKFDEAMLRSAFYQTLQPIYLTNTNGFLLAALVHAADIQDRDGAPAVLDHVRFRFPWMRHVFADGGYAGQQLRKALTKIGEWKLDIIKRADHAKGFHVLPRRWVVERTFAWLGRSRRLAKDWERTIQSSLAWLFIAHIRTLTRTLARP